MQTVMHKKILSSWASYPRELLHVVGVLLLINYSRKQKRKREITTPDSHWVVWQLAATMAALGGESEWWMEYARTPAYAGSPHVARGATGVWSGWCTVVPTEATKQSRTLLLRRLLLLLLCLN